MEENKNEEESLKHDEAKVEQSKPISKNIKRVLKNNFNVKKVVLTLIIVILFSGAIGLAYVYGYNSKECKNTNPVCLENNTKDDDIKDTKPFINPSPSTVKPTKNTTSYLPTSDKIETFDINKLKDANKEDAIIYIKQALNNLNHIETIGYKYVSGDGEEIFESYNLKLEKSKAEFGTGDDPIIWALFDNYYQFAVLNIFESSKEKLSVISYLWREDKQYFDPRLFFPSYDYKTNDNFKTSFDIDIIDELNDKIIRVEAGNDTEFKTFKAKSLKLENGKEIVEYTFDSDNVMGYESYIRFWIGTDGLIYLIKTPTGYSFTEISNIEYNQKYNLKQYQNTLMDFTNK